MAYQRNFPILKICVHNHITEYPIYGESNQIIDEATTIVKNTLGPNSYYYVTLNNINRHVHETFDYAPIDEFVFDALDRNNSNYPVKYYTINILSRPENSNIIKTISFWFDFF